MHSPCSSARCERCSSTSPPHLREPLILLIPTLIDSHKARALIRDLQLVSHKDKMKERAQLGCRCASGQGSEMREDRYWTWNNCRWGVNVHVDLIRRHFLWAQRVGNECQETIAWTTSQGLSRVRQDKDGICRA